MNDEIVSIVEERAPIETTITVDYIEVEAPKPAEIELNEAFPPIGEANEQLNHAILHNRDSVDQHPIVAITGLREELDEIESLKSVYADKVNVANYYKWNTGAYDTAGYFVSLVPHSTTVKICDGADIFGVTVDSAGFIGGQNEEIPRDNSYALVATSGLVDVRCESTVAEGDHVISNAQGMAEKTTSGCGYKVIAVNDDRTHDPGVLYATIALGVQACTTDAISKKVRHIEERIDNNEINIAAAMNVANQAYNKAQESMAAGQIMSDQVSDALGKVEDMEADVENMGAQVGNIATITAQAKAIAESAATSAESMKNEAVEKANEALADTSKLRKEFEEKVAEIDTELDNATLELEATRENIVKIRDELQANIDGVIADLETTSKDLQNTRDELQSDINDISKDLEDVKADIDTSREELQGNIDEISTSLNDTKTDLQNAQKEFQNNIDKMSKDIEATQSDLTSIQEELQNNIDKVSESVDATNTELNDVKTELNQSIENTAKDIGALAEDMEPLVSWSEGEKSGVAGFVARADENSTTIASIVTWQEETNESIAGFKQEVSDTYATIESVTKLKSETNESIAGIKQEATKTYATIESVAKLESDTSEAIAGIKQEVAKTYATIESVTSVETETAKSIAGLKQEVSETYATIESVTALETETSKAIAGYRQEVAETYATIESVTKLQTDTAEAIVGVKQEASETYATIEALSALKTETSSAIAGVKQEVGETYATIDSVASLQTETSEAIAGVRQDVSETYATIESVTELETNTTQSISDLTQEVSDTYATIESVTSLQTNTSNAIAGVKQEAANTYATIESVTSLETETSKAIAGVKQEASDTYATIDSVTALETQASEAIAGVKQEVAETYATIESVATLETNTSNAISAVKQTAENNKAQLDVVSSFTYTGEDGKTSTGLAGLKSQVTDNATELSTVANYETGDVKGLAGLMAQVDKNKANIEILSEIEGDTGEGLAGLKAQVDANTAELETIASHTYTDADGNVLKGLAAINQQVTDQSAEIDSIVSWQGTTNTTIAGIEQKANDNAGSISILTEWKSDVESDVSSIASIKAQSDANKSSIEGLTSWQGTASESLTSVKQQSDTNKASIEAITLWQGETTESITEVRQQADDNASSIESLTSWKDDTIETISTIEQTTSTHESSISSLTLWQGEAQTSIANVEQKVGANESKINSLTSWQGEASESIANVEQKAADNEAAITSLTTWKGEATESISAIQQTANQNSADISLIASWKSDVEDDVSSIASIKTTADTNKASIEQLVKKDTELSTTIAGVKTTADANEASIEQITTWQDKVNPTINSVAGIKQTADGNAAKIEGLTSWQGETNTAMARVEQKADANGAYIQSTVSNMDKYSVGPYSQAYGFTLEQAKDVLEKGMVYVPTVSHGGESFNTNYAFTKTSTYTWSGETWIEDVGKVVFSSTAPSGSAYSLWYTDNDTVTSGYEPYTLYKYGTYETVDDNGNPVTKPHWKPVATLKGNSSNRAVSQIRQDTNSIELSVTTLDDKYAGTKIWVDDNKSAIQDTVKWKGDNAESIATFMQEAGDNFASTSQVAKIVDKDGNINAASIVTAVNNAGSSVVIEADHVNLNGYVTMTNLSTGGETVIDGANIKTGTIDAEKISTNAIRSHNYPVDRDGNPIIPSDDDHFSSSGTFLDLSNGAFYSPNFAISNGGNVHFQGTVVAQGGEIAGWDISGQGLTKADTNIEIGLSPGNGGTYNNGLDNLGLVLYAGTKAPREPKAIAGTWRFTDESDVIKDFLRDAYLRGSVEFPFYGWFNHPTSGWTKYEGQNARLTFVYSGDEAFEITLSVDNSSAQMLWGCGSYNAVPWTSDLIGNYLLNREIGFGVEGIDDVWIGDYHFGTNILNSIATFIPGSIGLYPTMLDKDGRLYAQEVRLGGSADSVIEVGRCAVGNLIINNDAIIYQKGWDQAGGLYFGKDGLTVGENFRVQSQGVSTASVIVGGAASTHTDGTVACEVLNATDVAATNIEGDNCTLRQIDLNATSANGAAIFHSNASYVHCNAKLMQSVQNTSGRWQGMMIDFGTNTLQTNTSTALRIGPTAGGFQVLSDGTVKDSSGNVVHTSDARLKHDIESLDERYDDFFDNLEARRFKYNVGTSDRYHIGYTTQGVQEALKTAEIPEQEFAGVVTLNQGTEDEESALRYYEFVSLNTDQIQKLKKRVDALEAKNAELEARLAKLEALLINNAE